MAQRVCAAFADAPPSPRLVDVESADSAVRAADRLLPAQQEEWVCNEAGASAREAWTLHCLTDSERSRPHLGFAVQPETGEPTAPVRVTLHVPQDMPPFQSANSWR